MSSSDLQFELPPAVRRVLDAVRRRIRAYVWAEGLALLVVLGGAAFWLGLAVDWTFEPSPRLRQIGLIALALAALYVIYRYLLRRVIVPIGDSTIATLLERRFPALNEHVQTTVDVTSSTERAALCHPDFLYQTQQAAAHAVAGVRAGELFNRRPLVRSIGAAVGLILSIGLFALISRDAFSFWLERIALRDQPWPRRVNLEVVGFPTDAAGRRVHKLAQDDDFELLVHARMDGYEVPSEVEIRFRLADGRRGRDTMIRVGEAQPRKGVGSLFQRTTLPTNQTTHRKRDPTPSVQPGEFQLFRYQFKRVAGDMEFDVVGGDDRVGDLHLQVVDRPELYAIELECVYPDYLERQPRRLPVTGGMRIPEGTRLVLHAGATKPLTAARIHRANDKQDARLEFPDRPQNELRWQYGTLAEDDVLLVSVTDTDGVATREPYRISLAVVPDEVPQVAVRLAGIGSAITPDALLPLVGKITDDYGLNEAWFEYQIDGGPLATRPLAVQPGGDALLNKLDSFDLRAIDEPTGQRALELKPGQRFTLTLKASDRFDLSNEPPVDAVAGLSEAGYSQHPRAGSSQQFTLEIVTLSDLLALLERRELALRQRYEAIYEKMTDTRNVLGRVEFDDTAAESAPDEAATVERGGEGETGREGDRSNTSRGDVISPSPTLPLSASERNPPRLSEPTSAQRALARRRLRVAGSLQNVVQAADEIDGVAEGFDDLGEQLTNNRIDNPDLQSRLREQIALPLHRIAKERMPKLTAQLKLVEQHVEDAAAGPAELAKAELLADEILVEMREVLDRMLELETYNEVVALLRDIITDQSEISRRTKERQKERLRSLFEEE